MNRSIVGPTVVILLEMCLFAGHCGSTSGAQPIPPAELLAHFPSRMHACVWRNWQAVEPERIAKVLGTSVENVTLVAESMGLPPATAIPPEQKIKGCFWITMCRRNWHVLPGDQLAMLLGTTWEQVMHFLQVEDVATWLMLGASKPELGPLRYEPPTTEQQRRTAQIKRVVRQYFGEELRRSGEPRFEFVRRLSQPLPTPETDRYSGARSFSPRYICSCLKIYGDPLMDAEIGMYPEGLLERYAEVGVDGVWLYGVLRELAPGGKAFPEFGENWQQRQANLRTLVARAKRHGIGVYLYINEPRAIEHSQSAEFFKNRPEIRGVGDGLCTSQPAVRQWMSDALAHLFKKRSRPCRGFHDHRFREPNQLRLGRQNCHGRMPPLQDRGIADIIAEVNATIEAGVHRGNPHAKVFVWDWGWRNAQWDCKAIISKLPKSAYLLSISEFDKPIHRGGTAVKVNEYSLSVVGPGPSTLEEWAWARQLGLKTAAKVQVNNSWELASLPYLPVMDLVAEHCHNLASAGVDAMMLSWSLGGYPSPNLEIAERLSRKPTPTATEALDAVASRHFGPQGAPYARKAWTAFSKAFSEYPFDQWLIYFSPVQLGPANLLYPKRTGWRATMTGIPYDDLDSWRGPYPPLVFAAQMEKMAAGVERGTGPAADGRGTDSRPAACGRRGGIDFRPGSSPVFPKRGQSDAVCVARDALARSKPALAPDQRRQRLEEIRRIVRGELAIAREMFTLANRNSCVGFEPASQYFYLPLDLVEKVFSCRQILDACQEEQATLFQSKPVFITRRSRPLDTLYAPPPLKRGLEAHP